MPNELLGLDDYGTPSFAASGTQDNVVVNPSPAACNSQPEWPALPQSKASWELVFELMPQEPQQDPFNCSTITSPKTLIILFQNTIKIISTGSSLSTLW